MIAEEIHMHVDYDFLREFADSWVLLMMFLYFVSVALWALRPSARSQYDDAASIPFKED
jgi:cytochrome c oxidase cbb3-type subunit IV